MAEIHLSCSTSCGIGGESGSGEISELRLITLFPGDLTNRRGGHTSLPCCLIAVLAGPPDLKDGATELAEEDGSGVGLPVSES